MPERTRKRHPADLNKLAASIAHAATEGEPEVSPEDEGKNPHAVALGRLGGMKGGKARAGIMGTPYLFQQCLGVRSYNPTSPSWKFLRGYSTPSSWWTVEPFRESRAIS